MPITTPLLTVRAEDIESVSFRNPGATSATAGLQAFRRSMTIREMAASGGKYTSSDLVWHVPVVNTAGATQLGTTTPLLGAVITDAAGQRWTALESACQTRNSRWRFITRNLAIHHGLGSLVTIQKARQINQPAGDVQPEWHDWLVGLKAKVQLQGSGQSLNHDVRLVAYDYRIFLEQEPPEPLVSALHRIVGADGTLYKIQRFDTPQTITDLYEVSAQSIPWPQAS